MPVSVNAIVADNATEAPESARRLSVSLVGRLGVRFNGRPIELRTRKAGAVLSYLALSEAKQESRERLVGLLWSRSDEEKARASLRQVVRELRSMLEEAGYDGFVAERLMIGLDVGRIEVDIESVIQLAEGGRVHPLLLDTPQLDGRILEGMDDLDPSFRVWVLAKRQTIHERLMRNLDEGLTSAQVPAGAKKRHTRKRATSPVRCGSTRRCGICWIVIMRWSRRRPPRSSSRTSSSAFWNERRPIAPPRL